MGEPYETTCPKCGYPESPEPQWCLECQEYEGGKQLDEYYDEDTNPAFVNLRGER